MVDAESTPTKWVSDEEVSVCQLCLHTEFGFWVRKHHCRFCGLCVCASCSSNKMATRTVSTDMRSSTFLSPFSSASKTLKLERACDACYNEAKSPESRYQIKEGTTDSEQDVNSPMGTEGGDGETKTWNDVGSDEDDAVAKVEDEDSETAEVDSDSKKAQPAGKSAGKAKDKSPSQPPEYEDADSSGGGGKEQEEDEDENESVWNKAVLIEREEAEKRSVALANVHAAKLAEEVRKAEEAREAEETAGEAEEEADLDLAREQAEEEADLDLAREQAEEEADLDLAREQAEEEADLALAREQAEEEADLALAREQAEDEVRRLQAAEQAKQAREAEEQRKIDEARRADEALVAERDRQKDQARVDAGQAKAANEQAAEQARRDSAARAADFAKIAEETRLAKELRNEQDARAAAAAQAAQADETARASLEKEEAALKFAALARLQARAKAEAVIIAEQEAAAEEQEQQEKLSRDVAARDRRRQNEAQLAEQSASAFEQALVAKKRASISSRCSPSMLKQVGKAAGYGVVLLPLVHILQLLAQTWVSTAAGADKSPSSIAAALVTAGDAIFSPNVVQLVCRQLRRCACVSLSMAGYSVLTVLFLWVFFCGALESAISALSLSHLCQINSQYTSAAVHSLRAQLHQHLHVYMNSGLHETAAYVAQAQSWVQNGALAMLPAHMYGKVGTLGTFGLMVYFVFLTALLLWSRSHWSAKSAALHA